MVETVIGSQIPLDAGYLANILAQNRLQARGQDLSARGQDLQARGQDIQVAIAQAEFEQRGQEALQQYELDVARFGLDKAREMYTQRLQKAQLQLAASSEGASQRAAAGGLKLDTLKTLASMRGPGDWVGYNSLVNGLAAPTGELVDPTSWANDIVDPMFKPGGPGLDLSSLDFAIGNTDALAGPKRVLNGTGARINLNGMTQLGSWGNGDAFLGTGAGGGGGGGGYGGGIPALQMPSSNFYSGQGTWDDPRIASTPSPEANWSGVRNQDVAWMKPGDLSFFSTGGAGPSKASDYAGFNVFRDPNTQYGANEEIPAGTPIFLRKLAKGGFVNDKASIVGEGAETEDLGENGEILLNPTGAPFAVLSNEDAKQAIADAMKKPAKESKRANSASRGKKSGLPKHAQGTVTDQGFYGVSDPNKLQFLQYSPEVLGNLPLMDTLRRGQVKGGRVFGGFGAQVSNPNLGVFNAPTNLNLQGIRDLGTAGSQMLGSVYEQGLKLDFGDLLERATRAAPFGARAGTKRYAGR